MNILKKLIIPTVILGVIGLVTLTFFSSLPNSSKVLLCPLLAELSLVLYFRRYQIVKETKSGLFYIYLTFLILLVFSVKMTTTFLYANGTLEWGTYSVIYFSFIGVAFVAGISLKLIFGGVNNSIKMQYKGENNLSKMKEICSEISNVLTQNKNDVKGSIRLLKEVVEAIEFSDPITHKKAFAIEKEIINRLEVSLKYCKNKHFDKIKSVIKESNGVLYLIQERNRIIKINK